LPEWFANLYDLLATATHSKHITPDMQKQFDKPDVKTGIAAIESKLVHPTDDGSAGYQELSRYDHDQYAAEHTNNDSFPFCFREVKVGLKINHVFFNLSSIEKVAASQRG
jgi:hypothetical protein